MEWLRQRWRDVGLSLVLAVVAFGGTSAASAEQPSARDLDWLAALFLLAGPVLLLARRRHPVAALYAILAVTVAYNLADFPHGPIFLSLLVAFVWAAGFTGHRRAGWVALGLGWCSFLWLPMAFSHDGPTLAGAVGLTAWLLVLATTTEVVRVRRSAVLAAARSAEEEKRRQASDERLRMAQELHDVLAHNLSLISVQAGVALHLDDPAQSRPALQAIREASGEALGELRRVLDVLRASGPGGDDAPLAPAPSLADLDQLVARTVAAGLDASLVVSGSARAVPGEVERAAYRIVQESLTNATRYAEGAPVRVAVGFVDGAVTVQVDDDGPGPAAGRSPGSGNGIAGMRERAAALGGSLDAGPRAGGGFRVRAWLPT